MKGDPSRKALHDVVTIITLRSHCEIPRKCPGTSEYDNPRKVRRMCWRCQALAIAERALDGRKGVKL